MHGECVQKYKLGNVNNFNLYKNRYCTDVKLTVYQMNTHSHTCWSWAVGYIIIPNEYTFTYMLIIAVGRGERGTGHCACHHHGTIGRATAGHWHRGSRGPRNHASLYQIQGRQATHSPQRLFPRWQSRPHLCSLHKTRQKHTCSNGWWTHIVTRL